MSVEEIKERTRLIGTEVRVMRSEVNRIKHDLKTMDEKIKENNDKVEANKKLPYLVATVLDDVWESGGYRAEVDRLAAADVFEAVSIEVVPYRSGQQVDCRLLVLRVR